MARYSYYKDVLGIEDINLLFGLAENDSFITEKRYKIICAGIEDIPSDDPYHDITIDAIHLEDEDKSEYGITESFMYLEDSRSWILVDEYNM